MFGLNEIYEMGNSGGNNEKSRLLTTKETMAYFSYKDPDAFLEFARRSGLPRIRMNSRRIMFDPAAVQAWIDRRTIGVRFK
jgi:predicted DNA-binding transcriptional regulator AlpA